MPKYTPTDDDMMDSDMSSSSSTDATQCLTDLVAYNGSLLLAHWRANTVTNEHRALGELYESMSDLTDDFAEAYMGKFAVLGAATSSVSPTTSPTADGLAVVQDLQKYFKMGQDDDLLNILADMTAALHKASYLLKSGGDKTKLVKLNAEEDNETPESEANETSGEQQLEQSASIEKPMKKKSKKADMFTTDDMPD